MLLFPFVCFFSFFFVFEIKMFIHTNEIFIYRYLLLDQMQCTTKMQIRSAIYLKQYINIIFFLLQCERICMLCGFLYIQRILLRIFVHKTIIIIKYFFLFLENFYFNSIFLNLFQVHTCIKFKNLLIAFSTHQ